MACTVVAMASTLVVMVSTLISSDGLHPSSDGDFVVRPQVKWTSSAGTEHGPIDGRKMSPASAYKPEEIPEIDIGLRLMGFRWRNLEGKSKAKD